jgi:hypothetical protein
MHLKESNILAHSLFDPEHFIFMKYLGMFEIDSENNIWV